MQGGRVRPLLDQPGECIAGKVISDNRRHARMGRKLRRLAWFTFAQGLSRILAGAQLSLDQRERNDGGYWMSGELPDIGPHERFSCARTLVGQDCYPVLRSRMMHNAMTDRSQTLVLVGGSSGHERPSNLSLSSWFLPLGGVRGLCRKAR